MKPIKEAYSIAANKEDFDQFKVLHAQRPQDKNRAETFHYLMNFHKEMQEFKPKQHHAKIVTQGESL